MKNNPTSLYVHIPFCSSICGYCDFPKVHYIPSLVKEYLSSLEKEINSLSINKNLKTIYIGGGTPTSLSIDELSFLLSLLKPYASRVKEYTVEANPESLSKDKLILLKEMGANRLSIGVESTDDKILSLINRKHTFDMVKRCIKEAREVGFDNINVDLILGLPNASKELLKKDINNLLSLSIDHISCYSLSINPNTMFYIRKVEEKSDDEMREYYDIVSDILSKNGFIHYEISNWAKENKESMHNLVYWNDERYYGVGLGAASFIDDYRNKNTLNLDSYNKGNWLSESIKVDINDDKEYYFMLKLRARYGINYLDYNNRFNEDFILKYNEAINTLKDRGLIEVNDECIKPTYEGMMILDTLILEFYKYI